MENLTDLHYLIIYLFGVFGLTLITRRMEINDKGTTFSAILVWPVILSFVSVVFVIVAPIVLLDWLGKKIL